MVDKKQSAKVSALQTRVECAKHSIDCEYNRHQDFWTELQRSGKTYYLCPTHGNDWFTMLDRQFSVATEWLDDQGSLATNDIQAELGMTG